MIEGLVHRPRRASFPRSRVGTRVRTLPRPLPPVCMRKGNDRQIGRRSVPAWVPTRERGNQDYVDYVDYVENQD